MATNKIINLIKASLMATAVIVAIPACTDDHFDIDASGDVGGNATQTLWEQLVAHSEVSNFATVLEKTPFFKDEAHKVTKDDGTPYTYKDVLSGTQTITVFAPTNDAFTQADRDAYLALINEDPYVAYLQLAGNHIARYRHAATGTGEEKMVTINGKQGIFDREAKTFKGIPFKTANINATNGTLHIIGQLLPFNYNLYEFIKIDKRFSRMKAWLTEHDTIYFDEDRSASGGSDADGNPIYVDSVYSTVNPLFWSDYEERNAKWVFPHKGFNANFKAEDSVWAAIIPTDAAWDEAFNRLEPYYNYAPYYVDKNDEDGMTQAGIPKVLTAESDSPDSLSIVSRRMDLASATIFNVRLQPRSFSSFWTEETFLNATELPKMFNTRKDTFAVNKGLSGDVRNWIFQGVTPEKISNGLAYPVNYWALMDGDDAFDVEVKANQMSLFQAGNMGTTVVQSYSFNNSNKLATDSLLGTVSENSFMYLSNGNSSPTVSFKLIDRERDHQVCSSITYYVKVVMVPDFYRFDRDSITGQVLGNLMRANIVYIDGKTPLSTGKLSETKTKNIDFEYAGNKVDTVLVDSITFPYSYKNITKSYPVLTLTSRAKASDLRKGYQHPFSIDRIILEAKKD